MTGGGSRWIVYVCGTITFSPESGREPFDLRSDVTGVAGTCQTNQMKPPPNISRRTMAKTTAPRAKRRNGLRAAFAKPDVSGPGAAMSISLRRL